MKVIVKDMNCAHCVVKIQKAVTLTGVDAKVDLKDRSVEFSNSADQTKVVEAITSAGYHPEV